MNENVKVVLEKNWNGFKMWLGEDSYFYIEPVEPGVTVHTNRFESRDKAEVHIHAFNDRLTKVKRSAVSHPATIVLTSDEGATVVDVEFCGINSAKKEWKFRLLSKEDEAQFRRHHKPDKKGVVLYDRHRGMGLIFPRLPEDAKLRLQQLLDMQRRAKEGLAEFNTVDLPYMAYGRLDTVTAAEKEAKAVEAFEKLAKTGGYLKAALK